MIPILYPADEQDFTSNGIGRLRDTISCLCVEERNSIYEVDFEYPVDGAHFDDIQCGRIIGVRHDDSNDVQPFDIVGYSKPIDGIVTFHAVHVSYRQRGIITQAANVTSLATAFSCLTDPTTVYPSNPFSYWTDKTSSGFCAAFDATPRSVKSLLGGVEGSILDTYGGEYEWDRFTVKLHSQRGTQRDLTIRYGVNMLDYVDDTDYSQTYSSIKPYWRGQDDNGGETVIYGDPVYLNQATYNGRNDCVAMDLTDKFETEPTATQLEDEAQRILETGTTLPKQTIKVDFVRLQDYGEFSDLQSLLECKLCDTINVVFPKYQMQGAFKIVKTTFDVLRGKYVSMELGNLSTTLSEALGLTGETPNSASVNPTAIVIDQGGTGASNTWNYRKWSDGTLECWARMYINSMNISSTAGQLKYATVSITDANYPIAFTTYPTVQITGQVTNGNGWVVGNNSNYSQTTVGGLFAYAPTSQSNVGVTVNIYAIGKWQ